MERPSKKPTTSRGSSRRARPAQAPAPVAPSPAPAPAAAGGSLLASVPVHAPPAQHPAYGGGGSPSGGLAFTSDTLGGTSFGALSVRSMNPPGQREFEPDVGFAGNFQQQREFVFPEGQPGVVIQDVRRGFAVRQGGASSREPAMTPEEIDALVVDEEQDAHPHATHGRYYEAFLPDQREDTFGMTSLAPLGADGSVRRRTTSGSFTMTGDARFYPTAEPHAMLDELGFSPLAESSDTPANGLRERRPGDDMLSLDAVPHPYTGAVRHSVRASFNTYGRRAAEDRDLDTQLVLNGRPWVEATEPAPAPAAPEPEPAGAHKRRRSSGAQGAAASSSGSRAKRERKDDD